MAWLRGEKADSLWLGTVTLAELRFGVELGEYIAKRQRLGNWLAGARSQFQGRVLAITEDTLVRWQVVIRRCQARRYAIPRGDPLIAAASEVHGLGVCSRGTLPYETAGLPVLNPWTGERFNGA